MGGGGGGGCGGCGCGCGGGCVFLKNGTERYAKTVVEDDLQQSSLLESHIDTDVQNTALEEQNPSIRLKCSSNKKSHDTENNNDDTAIKEIVEEDIIPMIAMNNYSEMVNEYLEIDGNGEPVDEERCYVADVETCQAVIEDGKECFATEENVDVLKGDSGGKMNAEVVRKTQLRYKKEIAAGRIHSIVVKGDSKDGLQTTIVPEKSTNRIRINSKSE